jgi:hypothetical protein
MKVIYLNNKKNEESKGSEDTTNVLGNKKMGPIQQIHVHLSYSLPVALLTLLLIRVEAVTATLWVAKVALGTLALRLRLGSPLGV